MFTYQNTKSTILFLLIFSLSVAQDADTTVTEEEVGGRESYTSLDVSYSQDKGNTDLLALYYGFNYTLIGDLGPFKDTEFLFDFYRNDDQLDGEPYTDDQALTLKFDVWANQRFSPFLFFQKSFDNVIGLEDRLNYGLGAKVGLPFGLSVSYAFLFEKEDYKFWSYTDSLAYDLDGSVLTGDYYYTDSVALVDTMTTGILLLWRYGLVRIFIVIQIQQLIIIIQIQLKLQQRNSSVIQLGLK